ncbi:MAG: isoaspartyl peptidase/L-asparaginase [Planctomycetes bacterium]|nr:isoaspartyl peptidase/L-asparaginase [Planctomycetota bacterium]
MAAIILAHGGAGSVNENSDGPIEACKFGAESLNDGDIDQTLRACMNACVVLENDPRFNAGTGSNLRMDATIQMDACLATSDGRIGAVACVEDVKNPILVARMVMDSPHVLLCGDGATRFARRRGIATENVSTPRTKKRHKTVMERLKTGELRPTEQKWRGKDMHGTIGAVARDADGSFAVGCSTGGTSMMLRGRVGDSPIFGSGVMLGPAGAVCATGDGEEVIRRVLAMRVYLRLEAGEDAQKIADEEVNLFPAPYTLGLIVVGKDSHGMAATNDKMARGELSF